MGVLGKIEKMGGDRMLWAKEVNLKGLGTYEKLAKQSAGKYSVGDEISLADVFLLPQLANAVRFGIDVQESFPLLH